MVIAGLIIIIIVLAICVCRIRQRNLHLIRYSKREMDQAYKSPPANSNAVKPLEVKEGEILDSEHSNVGHLQTTEMADISSPHVLAATSHFGPKTSTDSPQNIGRHAVRDQRRESHFDELDRQL